MFVQVLSLQGSTTRPASLAAGSTCTPFEPCFWIRKQFLEIFLFGRVEIHDTWTEGEAGMAAITMG